MNSINDFIEKYHLDSFDKVLELKSNDKISFLNDLNVLFIYY